MSFGRPKRQLLGAIAMLAPLPLPFNEVVGWPALGLFWLAVALFLWRTSGGELTPLPTWAMNLLGLAYLPVLFVDFVALWDGRLLRPLLHLALFALVAKLYGMRREKDKWHILLLAFFVFVAAMASSVHPTMILYLAFFLALIIQVLARFAGFHVLASYGVGEARRRFVPLRGVVLSSSLLTLLLAVPLFALLPRLGTPYVVGPGSGSGVLMGGAGLMEQVTLDVIGRIRTSRAVALRVSYETPPPANHEMRFRAGVYSEFRDNAWRRGQRRSRAVRRERDGFFHVAVGQAKAWMAIWLEPLASSDLVLPVETLALDLVTPTTLHLDEAGLISLRTPRSRSLNYRVGMAGEAALQLDPGLEEQWPTIERASGAAGVTPAISELARQVAGSGSKRQQAERLEDFLSSEYQYTLDLVGSQSDRPVEDFLLRWRRGHCEYFASSMVLMLRSLGIPARFVTGYLGGEYSPFEGYYVVRQSHAHAWVEAYLPATGWRTFDPTPAAGRPETRSAGWSHLFAQAYDYLVFRWDRYVLTYGFFDQVGIARRLLTWWSGWWRARSSATASAAAASESPSQQERGAGEDRADEPEFALTGLQLVPIALLIVGSAWWIWRHRPAFSGSRAYRLLRARIERHQAVPTAPSLGPLALAERLEAARPAAWAPARRVIELYLRESFGGQELDDDERRELQTALRDAIRGLRKTA